MSKIELLMQGPFTRAMARDAGLTDRMLQGKSFERVLPRVWRHTDHTMSDDDWRVAARLAFPATAHLTGISRIQAAGLDFGPKLPVRFVVQGDLHLAFDKVFLHRTKLLPPLDDVGVSIEAAFIAYAAQARVIDGIKVGDWLLHREHLDLAVMTRLAIEQLWRPDRTRSRGSSTISIRGAARCRSPRPGRCSASPASRNPRSTSPSTSDRKPR